MSEGARLLVECEDMPWRRSSRAPECAAVGAGARLSVG